MKREHDLEFKGEEFCGAIYGGRITCLICKNNHNCKMGDLIHPIAVNKDGDHIGHPVNFNTYRIYRIASDNIEGVMPGYCVLSIGFVSSSASVACGT